MIYEFILAYLLLMYSELRLLLDLEISLPVGHMFLLYLQYWLQYDSSHACSRTFQLVTMRHFEICTFTETVLPFGSK
jgi:hypothetical protein